MTEQLREGLKEAGVLENIPFCGMIGSYERSAKAGFKGTAYFEPHSSGEEWSRRPIFIRG